MDFLEGNTRYGQSDLVVTEADESDGSFLLLNPLYSVITNIDREHIDYYLSMDELITSYKRFIGNTKDQGCAFVCVDDYNLKAITMYNSKNITSYGVSQDADIMAKRIELRGLNGSSFELVYKGEILGRIRLSIIGMHNVLNSLAAIAVAMVNVITSRLKSFDFASLT